MYIRKKLWWIKHSIRKMEYIRNFLPPNRDDVKLHNLESGERSGHAIYPPLPPVSSNSQIGVGGGPNTSIYPTQPAVPNYSYSFPTSDVADSMQMETSRESLQSLSPVKFGMQSDANRKHSQDWDQADSNKVRIVAQTSRIPTVVSICCL
jgi:hypothetical protein